MFTIKSIVWKDVKLFWEKWRLYDVAVPIVSLGIDMVYTDLDLILKYESEKTLGFYHNDILIGLGQALDKSSNNLKIVGIANMAVDPQYRTNKIGYRIMEVFNLYTQYHNFDLSILYSSKYASQFNFYEKFGYINYPYENVMLKFFRKIDIPNKEYQNILESIGKF